MTSNTIDINKLVSDKDIQKALDKIKKRQHELQETRNREFYNSVVYSLFKRFEILKNPKLQKDGEYILSFEYEEKPWTFRITEREVRVKMLEDKFGEYTIKSTASNTSSINFYNTTLTGLPEIIFNFAVYVARNFMYEMKKQPHQFVEINISENEFELFG